MAGLSPPRRAAAPAALPPRSVGHVRDERQLPRPLDRRLQLALMHRARPRDPPGQDLAALGHERAEQLDVLVVDVVDLVCAELAHLAAAEHRTALPRPPVRALALPAARAPAGARRSLRLWLCRHATPPTLLNARPRPPPPRRPKAAPRPVPAAGAGRAGRAGARNPPGASPASARSRASRDRRARSCAAGRRPSPGAGDPAPS